MSDMLKPNDVSYITLDRLIAMRDKLESNYNPNKALEYITKYCIDSSDDG